MTPIICTDVMRDEGKPLYEVSIHDIDTPVNFHSYDCLFLEQGRELEPLLKKANQFKFKLIAESLNDDN